MDPIFGIVAISGSIIESISASGYRGYCGDRRQFCRDISTAGRSVYGNRLAEGRDRSGGGRDGDDLVGSAFTITAAIDLAFCIIAIPDDSVGSIVDCTSEGSQVGGVDVLDITSEDNPAGIIESIPVGFIESISADNDGVVLDYITITIARRGPNGTSNLGKFCQGFRPAVNETSKCRYLRRIHA